MSRLLLASVLFTVLLTGCVQRSTYNNSGKPADKPRIDNVEAAKTRIALGLQYLKVGEMSGAKFNLEKAKTFAPRLPGVHTAFAYYFQKVGEDELAEQSYVTALGFDPNDADTLNNYGTFLCKVKRYKEAETALLKAISIPSYLQVAKSYENAALCAMENKQYKKAKKYFGNSLEHSALRANTLVNIAGLSYAMGDYRDAQKYSQRLSNIGVVSPRVLMLRALTELKLGNVTQSKKHGTTLVSMYVKSPEALIYLSKAFENSEFEQLRRLYLKHQYQAFKEAQKDQRLTASSKDKIKKVLKPQADGSSTVSISTAKPQFKPKNTEPVKKRVVVAKPKLSTNITPVTHTASTPVQQQSTPEPEPPVVTQQVAKATPTQSQVEDGNGDGEQIVYNSGVPPLPAHDLKAPYHIVTQGQGLFEISMKYNIKMKHLLKWNQLQENAGLRIGRKLFLNNPNIYHVIDQGDTLYGISLKYNIVLDKLLQWNELSLNARLTLGQKILIVNPKRYFL